MVTPGEPLDPPRLGSRIAEIYRELGPLYRDVQRLVESKEAAMGMSVGVRAVLEILRETAPGHPVPAIAASLGLSRQFVQRMVNDALGCGWVERVHNPAHARSRIIRLTPPGADAIDTVLHNEQRLMGRTGGGLTDTDVDTTLRVLRAMRAAVDAQA